MNSRQTVAPTQVFAEVIDCEEEAPHHFLLTLRAPFIAAQARAGQFVHVLPRGAASSDPFLRRAFSIMRVQDEAIEILFRVGGRGTTLLSTYRRGDILDLLGPLGQPFDLSMFHVKQSPSPTPILVGGGIGVPPMVFLANDLKAIGIVPQVLIGARSADEVVAENRFAGLEIVPQITTDDGSRGLHGRITAPLETTLQLLQEHGEAAIIYACGPAPMLKAVAAVAARAGARCQVSMEENMPCGIGVCNGCVVAMRDTPGDAPSDYDRYQRVCVAGPALWASDIDWERF